ncbi:hypothetical protein KSP40_PGU017265 [Platanthera guangdongensis]|uniref:Uncharacterized protein n=1 Tax=Platanthera guangdongensis TaxID=2320717 RepID=A0ABR2MUK0_9ASPA
MDPTILVGEVIYNAFFPFSTPDIVFSPDEEFRPLLPAIDGACMCNTRGRFSCSPISSLPDGSPHLQ